MNKLSKIIMGVLVVVLIAFCGNMGYYIGKKVANVENQSSASNKTESDNEIENSTEEQTSQDGLTTENMAMLMYYCPDFTNVKELTSKTLIEVVYAGINRGYIEEINSANSENEEGIYYKEEDIKKVIKNIFNVDLKENVSAAGFEYKDGKYFFVGADGDVTPSSVEVKETKSNEYTCTVYVDSDEEENDNSSKTFKMVLDETTGAIVSKTEIK